MSSQTLSDDYLLTRSEVSRRFGISKKFLETTGNRAGGPPVIRLGPRTLKYRPSDVREWLAKQRSEPTG